MTKRRSLKDLYVRGEEVTIDDGTGDPVVVWVQKLNPVEYSACLKKADAARSRVLSLINDKKSEDYLAIASDVLKADRDILITILEMSERSRTTATVQAEVESEKQWKDENYLEGLREAWEDLEQKFVDDPDDKEAKRAYEELTRFADHVEKELDFRMETFVESLKSSADSELQELAMNHNLKLTSDIHWMTEFYKAEIMFAIRDAENHNLRMFETRADVDDIQAELYSLLLEGVQRVMMDPVEGKGLAGSPPSSASSELSEQEVA